MNTKSEKTMCKKLVESEKRVSNLERQLKQEKEKVKSEKKKNKNLTEKLSRSNSSKSAIKQEVVELKKNCQSQV